MRTLTIAILFVSSLLSAQGKSKPVGASAQPNFAQQITAQPIAPSPPYNLTAEATSNPSHSDEKSSNWVLALIGILQTFVFGYQALKLRETVKASGEQAQAMERHIGEAARSANAMEEIADQIGNGNKVAMRAYVTTVIGGAIYQERREGQDDLRFQGKVKVVNTGSTPARKVHMRKHAAILPIPELPKFNFPIPDDEEGERAYAFIGAHQNYVIDYVIPDFVPDAEVQTIKEGNEKALIMWGEILYEDIFGDNHRTKFAHWLYWLPDGNVYGYYVPGQNDSD